MTRNIFLNHDPDPPPYSGDSHWIFLTPPQAVDAVARDFQAYGPQPDLLRRIAPLILGSQCRIVLSKGNQSRVTIRRGNSFEPIQDHPLGFYLIHVMETAPPDLNTLGHICRLVFQTLIVAGQSPAGNGPGIWVRSQMDGFVCRQCGQCCRQLDYETECGESDIRLWQDLGRTDILAWVQCRDIPGDPFDRTYRIWVDPDTGETARTCPWLVQNPDHPDRLVCFIHAIKPEVCRQYPYTAKHAAMTGCSGRFNTRTEPPFPLSP